MHVGVIGVNHKVANVSIRELFAKAFLLCFSLNTSFDLYGISIVTLSTCNRAELYFTAPDLTAAHQQILDILRQEIDEDFEQKCYSFFGKDAFCHLCQVTAGLDSAIIAETEIQGQVKNSYETAAKNTVLPKELHLFFQKALKIAKEVRTGCPVSCAHPDIEHVLFAKVSHFFRNEMPAVLFVGASEINIKIARFLQKKGCNKLTFTNRTKTTADAIAEKLSCQLVPWTEFRDRIGEFPCIITATKSPYFLITPGLLENQEKKLLIDLSVPRNIDPQVEHELINIDSLQSLLDERKKALEGTVQRAGAVIEQAVNRLFAAREAKELLQQLV